MANRLFPWLSLHAGAWYETAAIYPGSDQAGKESKSCELPARTRVDDDTRKIVNGAIEQRLRDTIYNHYNNSNLYSAEDLKSCTELGDGTISALVTQVTNGTGAGQPQPVATETKPAVPLSGQ